MNWKVAIINNGMFTGNGMQMKTGERGFDEGRCDQRQVSRACNIRSKRFLGEPQSMKIPQNEHFSICAMLRPKMFQGKARKALRNIQRARETNYYEHCIRGPLDGTRKACSFLSL